MLKMPGYRTAGRLRGTAREPPGLVVWLRGPTDSTTTCDALINPVRSSAITDPRGNTISYQSPTRLTTSTIWSFESWVITTLTPLGRVQTSARSATTRTVSAETVAATPITNTHATTIRPKDIWALSRTLVVTWRRQPWSCVEDAACESGAHCECSALRSAARPLHR